MARQSITQITRTVERRGLASILDSLFNKKETPKPRKVGRIKDILDGEQYEAFMDSRADKV